MDYDAEIRDLKAALIETKLGVAGLATCIAQTLATCDPSSQPILATNLRTWSGTLAQRQRPEAKEIALLFGRAFVDPAWPMSSDTSTIGKS